VSGRAARDVPVGQCWAWHEHRTMAAVMFKELGGAMKSAVAERQTVPASDDERRLAFIVAEVMRERARQIAGEGHTPAHDDTHRHAELAGAAASYLALWVHRNGGGDVIPAVGIADDLWPWKLRDRRQAVDRRTLVTAAALVIAEIERVDRLAGT
jgi:hypothetical protein